MIAGCTVDLNYLVHASINLCQNCLMLYTAASVRDFLLLLT